MRILFEVLARRGLIAVFICAQSGTNNSLHRQYPTLIDITDMYPTLIDIDHAFLIFRSRVTALTFAPSKKAGTRPWRKFTPSSTKSSAFPTRTVRVPARVPTPSQSQTPTTRTRLFCVRTAPPLKRRGK